MKGNKFLGNMGRDPEVVEVIPKCCGDPVNGRLDHYQGGGDRRTVI